MNQEITPLFVPEQEKSNQSETYLHYPSTGAPEIACHGSRINADSQRIPSQDTRPTLIAG